MDDALTASVSDLLRTAAAQAASPERLAEINELSERLVGPLRVAIAGKVKAGKSTLLNALIGEELAPTDAGECTRIITWYSHGDQPQIVLHPKTGAPEAAYFTRAGALEVELGNRTPADIHRLEVSWPIDRLAGLTLIDTPGIDSISADLSARTLRALTPEDDRPPLVDAVMYLLRHTHKSDIRFLESFHDDDLGHGTPMNAVGVLSRADEIGSCSLDALDTAERIATRYQSEPRLRRLCPVIVPVAGLLGNTAVSLRQPEYRALVTLARGPMDDCDHLLLTVDRFATHPSTIAVTELEREHLLDRFGLFGVRWCIEQIRLGRVQSATELAAALQTRSGLTQLRKVLLRQFTERSRILKAHSALAGLQSILRTGGCVNPDGLRARIEQITANAHAFEEVRLLNELRTNGLELTEDRAIELDFLLGGSGHDPASRLRLPESPDNGEIRSASVKLLQSWQLLAEHPLTSRTVEVAARGAIRTLEGIMSRAATEESGPVSA